jgi:predicted Rossmann fold flavoprotein
VARKKDYPYLKKDKLIYEDFGEMLFTHFGVSGPLCLSASSYISKFMYDKKNLLSDTKLDMIIDLKPALSYDELDKRVLRDFEEFHNREYQNSLGKLLPRLLIPVIIKRTKVSPDKRVNAISAEERKRLVDTLKGYKLTITGLRDFNEAIITGGGISVKEINPQNMELKKVKNLRVAGEIIDCDALTGGFNLQIAWSTAFMAAEK